MGIQIMRPVLCAQKTQNSQNTVLMFTHDLVKINGDRQAVASLSKIRGSLWPLSRFEADVLVHTVPQFRIWMLSRAKALFTNSDSNIMGLLNFVNISVSEHGLHNI
jgi:hypothetical protein